MRSVVLVIVAAVLAACSSGGSGPTGSGNPSPSGQSVSVRVGGEAVVPGTQVTIRFHEVTEDSRCPSNVVCVWEGNGQVALTLSTPSDAREVLLNTTSEPRRIDFAGSRIALASLAPYPSGEPVDPGAYVATFEVEPD
jgi:hypothetical protein